MGRLSRPGELAALNRFVVGLTGGIGSGKSSVAALLAQLGASVVDADRITHRLYEPQAPGSEAVARIAGREVLDSRGAVDRQVLGKRLFADRRLREQVEAAVHPLVMGEVDRWLDGVPEGRIPIVEAALLIETGLARSFSCVVLVTCPDEIRVERLRARNPELPEEAVRRRLAAQMTDEQKRPHADVEIENRGTMAELETRCREVFQELLGRSRG